MKKIYVPYLYVDNNNNIIEEIREAEEFSFFRKIKILIFQIIFNITGKEKWKKRLNKISSIKEWDEWYYGRMDNQKFNR